MVYLRLSRERNMTRIQQIYLKYSNIDKGEIGKNKAFELREELKNIQAKDLVGVEDHKKYLELLHIFRGLVRDFEKLNGENFLKTIREMLSVGTNGIYSNELHFMDELIQNVDDCEYDDPKNAKLSIRCDFNYGVIVFEYNEKGFSPFNVFAITGLAEQAKNVDPDKIQIGEKGLGFKSVFGVADSVLIQSGYFSFRLKKDDFTCPIPEYSAFELIKGTRLTLYMEPEKVKKIFYGFSGRYKSKDALLSKNPLLFLNKLSELRVFFDGYRSLKFTVDRKIAFCSGDKLQKAEHVKLTYEDGHDFIDEVVCTHYLLPVIYNRESCVSRYGEKTAFQFKKMNMQIIVPELNYVKAKGIDQGRFYSFLPTKIEMPIPIVCHIPFKLDPSREQVDSQKENQWFTYSCGKFSEMFESVLKDLANTYKEDIVYYLPKKHEYLFKTDKEYDVFNRSEFKGENFLKLPLFYTTGFGFLPADQIYVFSKTENFESIDRVAELLKENKQLFHAPDVTKIKALNIDIIQDAPDRLFNKALSKSEYAKEIFNILDKCKEFSFEEKIKSIESIRLNFSLIAAIFSNKKCSSAFKEKAKSSLKYRRRPEFIFDLNGCKVIDVRKIDESLPIEESDFEELSQKYLSWVKFQCVLSESVPHGEFFITKDALILPEIDLLSALSSFCRFLDPKNVFAATLELRSCSRELDLVDDSMSATEYLRKLRAVRKSIQTAFGKDIYNNYVNIINQAGTDPGRYLNELLQNADDCEYAEGVNPVFVLQISKDLKKIGTRYNEKGFTKLNTRAITAIGESTKKKLIRKENSTDDVIGEKGIGFKSVFAVANAVSIYSGDFCFKLSAKEPTIPELLSKRKDVETGTVMIFDLKEKVKLDFFNEEKILRLCLCLRKLKHVKIGGFDVKIKDANGIRSVYINDHIYEYKIFTRNFVVNDEKALTERRGQKRDIKKEQKIKFYFPIDKKFEKNNKDFYLYSGLPTEIQIKIPLIIDAPFELDTARANVMDNNWNRFVLNEVYFSLKDMIFSLRESDGIDVLRFLNIKRESNCYTVDLFTNAGLNKVDFLNEIKLLKVLPTWKQGQFVSAIEPNIYRIPNWMNYVLECKSDILSGVSKFINVKEGKYEEVLNALDVKLLPLDKAVSFLRNCYLDFIKDENFLKLMYKYLEEQDRFIHLIRETLKEMKIIPVKGIEKGTTEFFSWNECGSCLYVKNSAEISPDNCWILKPEFLKKDLCEKFFNININELTNVIEEATYRDKVKNKVENEINTKNLYEFLLNEFKNNFQNLIKCKDYLIVNKCSIPLKNQLGELKKGNLYLSKEEMGYFEGYLIPSHLVHQECMGFAKFIHCDDISCVHYEGLKINKLLTEDDIEALQDDGINYGFEILNCCIKYGYIEDDLIKKYRLGALLPINVEYDENIFNQPIKDEDRFLSKMNERLQNPIKVISKIIEKTIHVGETKDGEEVSLDNNARRDYALRKYSPQKDYCVCQMCKKAKKVSYIEVNNIEKLPEYYWEECGIVLCLECSKHFEELRESSDIRERFYNKIKEANVNVDKPIEIPIGTETVTFSQIHLAEIQEILKRQDKIGKQ